MIRLALAAFALVAACSDLPPLGDATCGNGVIDRGEDCDGTMRCVACRVTCDATAADRVDTCSAVPAPHDATQYRCGADGLCHAGAGTVDSGGSIVPFPVQGFGITDVDHDHVGDVVGLSPSAIVTRFGDAVQPLARTVEAPAPELSGPPTVADIDGDATLDFVLPSADGVVAYTSETGIVAPEPLAFTYPAGGGFLKARTAFPIDATHTGQIFVLHSQLSPNDKVVGGVMDFGVANPLPATFELCSSDYDAGVATTNALAQDQVDAYAIPGHGVILALVAHHTNGAGELCVMSIVPSPTGGAPIVTKLATALVGEFAVRPTLANLDADPAACPSVIVSSQTAPSLALYAGSGTAGACTLASTATAFPGFPDGSFAPAIGRLPVALPGYGADALVSAAGGIFAYHAGDLEQLYASDRSVDRVAFGDLDGDGKTDAIVASATEPNVDVLYADRAEGTQPLTFRRVRVGTSAVPHHLAVGDFDGDGYDDAMFFVQPVANHDRMMIAYGAPTGTSAPIELARFGSVIAAVPFQFLDSGDPYGRVRDIGVAEERVGFATTVIGTLHGATDRAMIPFTDPRTTRGPGVFTATAAGHFLAAGQPYTDFAMVAVDLTTNTAAFWLLKGTGVGAYEATLMPGGTGSNSHTFAAPGWGYCGGATAPAFCLDDAAAVAWPAADRDRFVGIDTVQARIAVVDLSDRTSVPVYSDAMFPRGAHHPTAFLAPLDGRTRLVITTDQGAAACDLDASGHATCDPVVDQPTVRCIGGGVGRIGPGAPALYLLCDDRVVRFDVHDAGTTILAASGLTNGSTSLAIGDVTGDGVDDLVIGDGAGVRVFRQSTTTEAP